MGWTWDEYWAAPREFIEAVIRGAAKDAERD